MCLFGVLLLPCQIVRESKEGEGDRSQTHRIKQPVKEKRPDIPSARDGIIGQHLTAIAAAAIADGVDFGVIGSW